MQIADRLKSERKRLGLSQTAFAVAADAVRGTSYNWEKGIGFPTADALAAWANVGLDVLYVVTGSRSFVPPPQLTSEEQTLLDYYREASREARKAGLRALLSAGESKASQTGANSHQYVGDHGIQIGGAAGAVNINKPKGKK